MISHGFNKKETTEKGGKIKGKINPDEPSGQSVPEYSLNISPDIPRNMTKNTLLEGILVA